MNAVIVGGGKVGAHLARTLGREGNKVVLVEVDPDRCELLQNTMEGVRIVCGDGDEPYILDEADIRMADAVVAATGHDEDNLVVCLLAKMEYSCALTIARINNPSNAWLFTSRFGVDVPVSNTAIMADVLKKVSLGDIVTLLRLNAENMAIDELVLPDDSPAVGKTLAELGLPQCAQIMAIVSGDGVIVPRGDTTLHAGDELLILAQCEDEDALRTAFGVR